MDKNKVLAVVEGTEITEKDVDFLLQGLGPQQGMQFNSEEGRKQLLQELINQQLFYLEAIENNMDKDEEFQNELERVKESLLKQYAIRDLLNNAEVVEDEVTEYYNEHREQFTAPESVKASHILVSDEDKAKEIVKELNEGMSFKEGAKKYSTCPSKEKGGDLGYFSKGRMVPEFENAAFDMNVGDVSEPVKTQFGFHIIKVEDKKPAAIKTLGEVRDQIYKQLVAIKQNKLYLEKTAKLKEKYTVEEK
ncbi:peptidylprolyl isomerase [Clostridiisalibacter paucivorans]|uniref:peptidylprolyl isomerase n=1 Tax=Clostridiisalibacter paucivorans TaxID=408753 RepID=UPI0004794F97|nr:peptidylprolyl isomerase [Clostridiisalibacter paucivorans]